MRTVAFCCPGVRSDGGRRRTGRGDLIREQDGEEEVEEDGKDGGEKILEGGKPL